MRYTFFFLKQTCLTFPSCRSIQGLKCVNLCKSTAILVVQEIGHFIWAVMTYSYSPREYCGRIVFKMAAEHSLKETTAEKPMFTCSSCGFQCHYEYFGKKPPFSKSVLYVYCFRCIHFSFFRRNITLVCDSSKNFCDFKPPEQFHGICSVFYHATELRFLSYSELQHWFLPEIPLWFINTPCPLRVGDTHLYGLSGTI